MPKNNDAGATYFGHTGTVTNAVGEQFELDPTRDVNGDDLPGLERGEDTQEAPRPVDGATSDVPMENTDAREEYDRRQAERRDGQNEERDSDGQIHDRHAVGENDETDDKKPFDREPTPSGNVGKPADEKQAKFAGKPTSAKARPATGTTSKSE